MAEAAGYLIVKKMLIELQKFQKFHSKILQGQLQMSMIGIYLKKDISPNTRQKIIDDVRLM